MPSFHKTTPNPVRVSRQALDRAAREANHGELSWMMGPTPTRLAVETRAVLEGIHPGSYASGPSVKRQQEQAKKLIVKLDAGDHPGAAPALRGELQSIIDECPYSKASAKAAYGVTMTAVVLGGLVLGPWAGTRVGAFAGKYAGTGVGATMDGVAGLVRRGDAGEKPAVSASRLGAEAAVSSARHFRRVTSLRD